jgi:Fe-S-cluster-containing dehydrogenase component
MRRIYVIEDLCNGCRLCQTFCSSLQEGIFSENGRVKVVKVPGEEHDIPIVDCNGCCLHSIYENGIPTCVSVCPTGALIYAEPEEAATLRIKLEQARRLHSLFKVIAPWRWPFPWSKGEPEDLTASKGVSR